MDSTLPLPTLVSRWAPKPERLHATLEETDPSSTGFTRRRRGRGFSYLDEHGEPLADEATIARIKQLRIPPAWSDVWINPSPVGHLQALGTDAAGRRQYLYHETWRRLRDEEKFERMTCFAQALPELRERVHADLALTGVPRDRVLAGAARLLDRGFFRIGGEEYAEENETFGLATLERQHLRLLEDDAMVFDYVGKAGKRRVLRIVDPELQPLLGRLRRRRTGTNLLAYLSRRRWCEVRSGEINDYVKQSVGAEFSAKDFRTWHATVLAAHSVAVLGTDAASPTARRRTVASACREVSRYLGNTPAVCRKAYIDPRVFERFESGRTIGRALDADGWGLETDTTRFQRTLEEAVLGLLAAG
jgi:DNA topoisomerase I